MIQMSVLTIIFLTNRYRDMKNDLGDVLCGKGDDLGFKWKQLWLHTVRGGQD